MSLFTCHLNHTTNSANMITFFSSILITYLFTLVAIAFFTLLERKILGYTQERKGPNKVSLMGLPQPIADALKLFSKQPSSPSFSNLTPFFIAPLINLGLALLIWTIAPTISPSKFFIYSVVIFLAISRIRVYTTLIAGWSSNSKYSLLGALRGVAQTISYEVRIALILITLLLFSSRLNIQNITISNHCNVWLIAPILVLIWFTTMLAETNRAPFDFAEGESELVSGFNTEYARGLFALIFISEYLNIIFIALLTATITTQNPLSILLTYTIIIFKTTLLSALFVFVRTTYPRIRYDRLINLTWISFLPLSLIFISLFLPLV